MLNSRLLIAPSGGETAGKAQDEADHQAQDDRPGKADEVDGGRIGRVQLSIQVGQGGMASTELLDQLGPVDLGEEYP